MSEDICRRPHGAPPGAPGGLVEDDMTVGSALCSVGLTGIGVLMVLHPSLESWPEWVCFAVGPRTSSGR